jgi:UDP-4-amino-4,6-dideoxy-N-acetyl-beta-L-altrosamine transaminase
MSLKPFIPYGRHNIDDEDIQAVINVLKSDFLTCGPQVEAFEKALAEKVGARYAIACSNGTVALHLAYLALGLQQEHSILVPTLTFAATATAAKYIGCQIHFMDINAETGLISPDTWNYSLQSTDHSLKAIVPVHIAGQVVDMETLHKDARKRNLYIVEDACHAIGSTYQDKAGKTYKVGSCAHSDLTVFSFHPVKTIAMGEGGAITTNNPEFYEKIKRLRHHGMEKNIDHMHLTEMALDQDGKLNPWYYELHEIGYNYRLSDLHCALGLSQLKKLDVFKKQRSQLVEHYHSLLQPLSSYVTPLKPAIKDDPCYHLAVVLIDFSGLNLERADVMNALRQKGIGSQVHYVPLHLQPLYQHSFRTGQFPGAFSYYTKTLSLPLYVGMTLDDVTRVVNALRKILKL